MLTLTRLNGDSSWLIETGGLRLLLDPWLQGAQVDVGTWFNRQTHVMPCVSVEEIGSIDAIIVSHPFTDHCHLDTLRSLSPETPVIAPPAVIRKVGKMRHFETLHVLSPGQGLDFEEIRWEFFPSPRLLDPVHGALCLSLEGKRMLFYAPHGFHLTPGLRHELSPVEVLVTTFTQYRLPFFLGGTINLGGLKAAELARALQAKWLLPTHDEEKNASGLVAVLARVLSEIPEPEGELQLHFPETGNPVSLS